MLNPIAALIITVLDIYKWIVIAAVIVSWLVAFNVINLHHPLARQVTRFLDAVVQPMLRPIRRIVPLLGGVDLSYLVLLVILEAIKIAFYASLAPRLAAWLN